MEDIKNGMTAMLVTVRVRPLTSRELAIDPNETAKVLDNKMIILLDSAADEADKRGRSREAQFSFDFVYNNVPIAQRRRLPQNKFTTNRFLDCWMEF